MSLPVFSKKQDGDPELPFTSYKTEVATAVDAVLEVCRMTNAVQATIDPSVTITKADDSPVTIADLAAQALVNLRLGKTLPGFRMVGEESSKDLRKNAALAEKVTALVNKWCPSGSGPYGASQVMAAIDAGASPGGPKGAFWTLDPIDGTKGFIRKMFYSVALAYIVDGQVVVGVLGNPNLALNRPQSESGSAGPLRGCILAGVAREGAVIGRIPVAAGGDGGNAAPPEAPVAWKRLSKIAPLGHSLSSASYTEGFEPSHSAHHLHAAIAKGLGVHKPPIRMDSQCKYALLAKGDARIYFRLTKPDYRDKIWDHAAGWLLVTEVGGVVTHFDGSELNFGAGRFLEAGRGGIIVTTTGNHAKVLAQAAAVGRWT